MLLLDRVVDRLNIGVRSDGLGSSGAGNADSPEFSVFAIVSIPFLKQINPSARYKGRLRLVLQELVVISIRAGLLSQSRDWGKPNCSPATLNRRM
jgi:hypothetical protein